MHEVQLVHQAALLQQLERSIDRHAIQLGISFFCQLEQALRIQMLAALVDKFEEQLALPGKTHTLLSEGSLDGINSHVECHSHSSRVLRHGIPGCRRADGNRPADLIPN